MALSVVPYYNKPTQEGLYRHFRAIAEKVDLPLLLYNVPGRTVADLANETVLRLAQVPGIVGIKDATADLGAAARSAPAAARRSKDFAVYSGNDDTALPLMLLGGHGVISVTANVAPRLMATCAAPRSPAISPRPARSTSACCRSTPNCSSRPTRSRSKWALAEMGLIENDAAAPAHAAVRRPSRHRPRRPARGGLSLVRNRSTSACVCSRTVRDGSACRRRAPADRVRDGLALRRQEDRLQVHLLGTRARDPARPDQPAVRRPLHRHDRFRRRGARRHPPGAGNRRSRQNQTPEARVVRAGTERWLVVKASPDQAWTTSRQFWIDSGFVLAVEQPNAGHHGDRLGGEPRRHSAGLAPPDDRQGHGPVLHDVQARQVPHAARARRRAGDDGDLPVASRHGAGADHQDRQLVAGRRSRGR